MFQFQAKRLHFNWLRAMCGSLWGIAVAVALIFPFHPRGALAGTRQSAPWLDGVEKALMTPQSYELRHLLRALKEQNSAESELAFIAAAQRQLKNSERLGLAANDEKQIRWAMSNVYQLLIQRETTFHLSAAAPSIQVTPKGTVYIEEALRNLDRIYDSLSDSRRFFYFEVRGFNELLKAYSASDSSLSYHVAVRSEGHLQEALLLLTKKKPRPDPKEAVGLRQWLEMAKRRRASLERFSQTPPLRPKVADVDTTGAKAAYEVEMARVNSKIEALHTQIETIDIVAPKEMLISELIHRRFPNVVWGPVVVYGLARTNPWMKADLRIQKGVTLKVPKYLVQRPDSVTQRTAGGVRGAASRSSQLRIESEEATADPTINYFEKISAWYAGWKTSSPAVRNKVPHSNLFMTLMDTFGLAAAKGQSPQEQYLTYSTIRQGDQRSIETAVDLVAKLPGITRIISDVPLGERVALIRYLGERSSSFDEKVMVEAIMQGILNPDLCWKYRAGDKGMQKAGEDLRSLLDEQRFTPNNLDRVLSGTDSILRRMASTAPRSDVARKEARKSVAPQNNKTIEAVKKVESPKPVTTEEKVNKIKEWFAKRGLSFKPTEKQAVVQSQKDGTQSSPPLKPRANAPKVLEGMSEAIRNTWDAATSAVGGAIEGAKLGFHPTKEGLPFLYLADQLRPRVGPNEINPLRDSEYRAALADYSAWIAHRGRQPKTKSPPTLLGYSNRKMTSGSFFAFHTFQTFDGTTWHYNGSMIPDPMFAQPGQTGDYIVEAHFLRKGLHGMPIPRPFRIGSHEPGPNRITNLTWYGTSLGTASDEILSFDPRENKADRVTIQTSPFFHIADRAEFERFQREILLPSHPYHWADQIPVKVPKEIQDELEEKNLDHPFYELNDDEILEAIKTISYVVSKAIQYDNGEETAQQYSAFFDLVDRKETTLPFIDFVWNLKKADCDVFNTLFATYVQKTLGLPSRLKEGVVPLSFWQYQELYDVSPAIWVGLERPKENNFDLILDTRSLHAIAQVWVPGVGWMNFDATGAGDVLLTPGKIYEERRNRAEDAIPFRPEQKKALSITQVKKDFEFFESLLLRDGKFIPVIYELAEKLDVYYGRTFVARANRAYLQAMDRFERFSFIEFVGLPRSHFEPNELQAASDIADRFISEGGHTGPDTRNALTIWMFAQDSLVPDQFGPSGEANARVWEWVDRGLLPASRLYEDMKGDSAYPTSFVSLKNKLLGLGRQDWVDPRFLKYMIAHDRYLSLGFGSEAGTELFTKGLDLLLSLGTYAQKMETIGILSGYLKDGKYSDDAAKYVQKISENMNDDAKAAAVRGLIHAKELSTLEVDIFDFISREMIRLAPVWTESEFIQMSELYKQTSTKGSARTLRAWVPFLESYFGAVDSLANSNSPLNLKASVLGKPQVLKKMIALSMGSPIPEIRASAIKAARLLPIEGNEESHRELIAKTATKGPLDFIGDDPDSLMTVFTKGKTASSSVACPSPESHRQWASALLQLSAFSARSSSASSEYVPPALEMFSGRYEQEDSNLPSSERVSPAERVSTELNAEEKRLFGMVNAEICRPGRSGGVSKPLATYVYPAVLDLQRVGLLTPDRKVFQKSIWISANISERLFAGGQTMGNMKTLSTWANQQASLLLRAFSSQLELYAYVKDALVKDLAAPYISEEEALFKGQELEKIAKSADPRTQYEIAKILFEAAKSEQHASAPRQFVTYAYLNVLTQLNVATYQPSFPMIEASNHAPMGYDEKLKHEILHWISEVGLSAVPPNRRLQISANCLASSDFDRDESKTLLENVPRGQLLVLDDQERADLILRLRKACQETHVVASYEDFHTQTKLPEPMLDVHLCRELEALSGMQLMDVNFSDY